ncbi:hypothetical protein CC86DRAFT_413270 [Ophiobolus disseminans]|uniref:Zn(2)-C6 fungal-type domain-containing protein n=1 Tax=Ophiobolus disseminans TaxID=1469910 RepID=A0A6A6ZEQ5_9PLEO|nr:hypothetical protein CC86DRAFT_413270 [Ophiobolus disseminans]
MGIERLDEGMDDLERITGWLEGVTMGNGEGDNNGQPVTPPRRLTYEEISPTDTSFSGGSIFDIPDKRCYKLGTPCRKGPGRVRDDGSEATSCEADEDEEMFKKDGGRLGRRLAQPNFSSSQLQLVRLISHDPPSDDNDNGPISDDHHHHALKLALKLELKLPTPSSQFTTVTPRQSSGPRLTSLLSCLQCTLAALPCSRTTPSCTRCMRNNAASTCLLLRRRFHEETTLHTAPVLLKLKDTDDDVWKRKLEVAQMLEGVWRERADRKNWVLPRVESERRVDGDGTGAWGGGGTRGDGIWGEGEGMGRVVWCEVDVELEVGGE